MFKKKSDKANLENRKGVFFQLGLLIALSVILISFEWTQGGFNINEYETWNTEPDEDIHIPSTFPDSPPHQPPKPMVVEELKLVEDTYEIDTELKLDGFEITEGDKIEIIEFVEKPEEIIEDSIFYVVQDMPGFQGKGQDGFRIWISQHVKYPEVAADNGIEGTVYISFVVEADGSVTNVTLVRGVDQALNQEAIRVIQSSPKWMPGMQRDRTVRVVFTFPINFVLRN